VRDGPSLTAPRGPRDPDLLVAGWGRGHALEAVSDAAALIDERLPRVTRRRSGRVRHRYGSAPKSNSDGPEPLAIASGARAEAGRAPRRLLRQSSGARTPEQVGFGRHVDAPPKALLRVDARAIDLEWRVLLLCTGETEPRFFSFHEEQH